MEINNVECSEGVLMKNNRFTKFLHIKYSNISFDCFFYWFKRNQPIEISVFGFSNKIVCQIFNLNEQDLKLKHKRLDNRSTTIVKKGIKIHKNMKNLNEYEIDYIKVPGKESKVDILVNLDESKKKFGNKNVSHNYLGVLIDGRIYLHEIQNGAFQIELDKNSLIGYLKCEIIDSSYSPLIEALNKHNFNAILEIEKPAIRNNAYANEILQRGLPGEFAHAKAHKKSEFLGSELFTINKNLTSKSSQQYVYMIDTDMTLETVHQLDEKGDQVVSFQNKTDERGYLTVASGCLYINSNLEIVVRNIPAEHVYEEFSEILSSQIDSILFRRLDLNRDHIAFDALHYFYPCDFNEYSIKAKTKPFRNLFQEFSLSQLVQIIRKKHQLSFDDEIVQDTGELLKNFIHETIEALKTSKRIYWDGYHDKFVWSECECSDGRCLFCFRESLHKYRRYFPVDDIFFFSDAEIKIFEELESDELEIGTNLFSGFYFEHKSFRNLLYDITYLMNSNNSDNLRKLKEVIMKIDNTLLIKKIILFSFQSTKKSTMNKFLYNLASLEIDMNMIDMIPSHIFFTLLAVILSTGVVHGINVPIYLPYSFYCISTGIPIEYVNIQDCKIIKEIRKLEGMKVSEIQNIDRLSDLFFDSDIDNSILTKYFESEEQYIIKESLERAIVYNLIYQENKNVYDIFYKIFNKLLGLKMGNMVSDLESFSSFLNPHMNLIDIKRTKGSRDYISFIDQKSQEELTDNFISATMNRLCVFRNRNRNVFALLLMDRLNLHSFTFEQIKSLFTYASPDIEEMPVIEEMFRVLDKWYCETNDLMTNDKLRAFFIFVIGRLPTLKDRIQIKVRDRMGVMFMAHNCFNTLVVGTTNRLDRVEDILYESVFRSQRYTVA